MAASLNKWGIGMDLWDFGQTEEIYDPNNFPVPPPRASL